MLVLSALDWSCENNKKVTFPFTGRSVAILPNRQVFTVMQQKNK